MQQLAVDLQLYFHEITTATAAATKNTFLLMYNFIYEQTFVTNDKRRLDKNGECCGGQRRTLRLCR